MSLPSHFPGKKGPWFLVAWLSFATSLSAQIAPHTWNDLSAFLDRSAKRQGLPALSVVVVNSHSNLFERHTGRGVSETSSFVIGSLSKSITATAVMQLVEEKRVELDAPVRRYLPDFSPGGGHDNITVRDLLLQRSGFTRAQGFENPSDAGKVRATTAYRPGARFTYSNLNYALLGKIVERVSGSSFDEYLTRNVFEPLGMASASAAPQYRERETLAQGHRYLFWPAVPLSEPAPRPGGVPSGFIRASAGDMGRFLSAHLCRESSALRLSTESLQLLHSPPEGDTGYAMGWYRMKRHNRTVLRHSGLTSSFSSSMALLPEDDLGIVVLDGVNSLTAADEIRDGALRILLNLPPSTPKRTERWVRLGALALLLGILAGFARTVWLWNRLNRPLRFPRSTTASCSMALSAGIGIALIVVVPIVAKTPLLILVATQPDIGMVLLAGIAIGPLGKYIALASKNRRGLKTAPHSAPESGSAERVS